RSQLPLPKSQAGRELTLPGIGGCAPAVPGGNCADQKLPQGGTDSAGTGAVCSSACKKMGRSGEEVQSPAACTWRSTTPANAIRIVRTNSVPGRHLVGFMG